MKPPDWDRLQEIYHLALAEPRSARDVFLAKICAGDTALLNKVKLLLAADDSLSDILESPVTTLDPLPVNLIGQLIGGRFKVEKELGSGGMSYVYLAHDQHFNRPAVVKVLSEQLVHDPYVRRKFEHEVEALLRLKHPSLVGVSDKGELDDGRPYVGMEFIDGQTLRSEIPVIEGMNLERTASILTQIGDALDHVHDVGVVHRDLKPENIMLRRSDDSVVLIDFGIAKVTNPVMAPETTQAPPFGTLLYMSPEQLQGDEVTAASDIYSLAVVAFEMLDGRRPFSATSAPQLLGLQKAGVDIDALVRRRRLSPRVRKALSCGLSFNPTQRPKRAGEFSTKLAAVLRNEKQKPGHRLPVGREMRWRVFIAALILLVGAGAFYGYRKYSKFLAPSAQTASNAFSYFLTVQRMRAGKEYGQPFQSHGEDETFNNDDRFQLTVTSPQSAYVYIINEGPSITNDTNVTLSYPRATTNNGSAMVGPNQPVQTDWITFRGPAGDDNFWIVWSLSPVNQLENAKREAFNHPRGGLTDGTLQAVKEFLKTKQSEVDVKVYHYNDSAKATARGKSDLLVTLAQFKHR